MRRDRYEESESAVSRVLFPASAGLAGAPWGGSHPSRSPVTRRLQRPYPRTGRASRIVLLFGLAPGGVYRASRSPGCWWALTHTISPSPSLARRLCLFCGTLLQVTPTGRYPAPCSAELGLSSTGRSRRDCLADSLAIVPARSAGITHHTRLAASSIRAAATRKATVRPRWISGPDTAEPIGWPAQLRPIEMAKARPYQAGSVRRWRIENMLTSKGPFVSPAISRTAATRQILPAKARDAMASPATASHTIMTRRSRPSLLMRPAISAAGTEARP